MVATSPSWASSSPPLRESFVNHSARSGVASYGGESESDHGDVPAGVARRPSGDRGAGIEALAAEGDLVAGPVVTRKTFPGTRDGHDMAAELQPTAEPTAEP